MVGATLLLFYVCYSLMTLIFGCYKTLSVPSAVKPQLKQKSDIADFSPVVFFVEVRML